MDSINKYKIKVLTGIEFEIINECINFLDDLYLKDFIKITDIKYNNLIIEIDHELETIKISK